MNKTFSRVQSNNPGRSVFNLSYEKKLTCDMGELIPVMCDEVVPGDIFEIGNEVVIRLQPMVAPILHEINCFIHYFFVPYRLLWDDWEDFISGGDDGEFTATLPTWNPSGTGKNDIGTLWDYLGFPIDVDATPYPMAFPQYAYNFIYNEYYRDETQIAEVPLTNEDLLLRAWEKDYFTSALPWQQRGTAPALPITGTSAAVWAAATWGTSGSISNIGVSTGVGDNKVYGQTTATRDNLAGAMAANTVDLSTAVTFDVADLRLAFQIQKWMERNARAGARYTEFLTSHFGVSPRDDRLQRPEYIGGSRTGVIISEVLQTSSTDLTSPQGNLAGHGITANKSYVAKYRANEFGLIMGIMSIMPRTAYQQGIDRQWLRETKYDFYFPEFANLSEQAIRLVELYATNTPANNIKLFGYQGRYDEMRVKRNMVCGEMRDSLDYWHMGRIFGSEPELNQAFIECVPDKRVFAVQDEDSCICNVANLIKAIRPLPIQSNPGLIDHG